MGTSGLLGVIASVIAISEWCGFYPVGVIVLLSAGLIVALVVVAWYTMRASRPAGYADSPAQKHDAEIVREVRRLVGREDIEWLRDWDFGASWRDKSVDPFWRLIRLDNVEHRAHDAELNGALRRLFDATDAFTHAHAWNTWPDRVPRGEEWRNLGWSAGEADDLGGEERRIWEERRDLLNSTSEEVVNAYDDFVDVARRKHVLPAEGVHDAEPPDLDPA